MRYFYHEPGGARVGPYTRDELRQLHLSGVVKPDTLVTPEGAEAPVVFSELWAEWQDPQHQPGKAYATFAARTGEDLRTLAYVPGRQRGPDERLGRAAALIQPQLVRTLPLQRRRLDPGGHGDYSPWNVRLITSICCSRVSRTKLTA